MLQSALARAPRLAQWWRYAVTSGVANLTTITVLAVLVGGLGFAAGWSNVVATGVATIPSFELNRRWVWSIGGRSSIGTEVVPFFAWAFAELGLSTLAVHIVASHATAAGWDRGLRTVAVEVTTIGATGALWILQFFLFDRVLFRRRPAPAGPAEHPEPVSTNA